MDWAAQDPCSTPHPGGGALIKWRRHHLVSNAKVYAGAITVSPMTPDRRGLRVPYLLSTNRRQAPRTQPSLLPAGTSEGAGATGPSRLCCPKLDWAIVAAA